MKNTRIKKAGYYLVGYHHGLYDTLYQTYQKMLRYASDCNIQLGQFAYEEYVISDMAQKEEKEYITMICMETINT